MQVILNHIVLQKLIEIIFRVKSVALILLFILSSVFVFGQTNTDLVGRWYNDKKDIEITLFEDGEKISGIITWMKFPNDENGNPKTDFLNPDENLRSRGLLGMTMISSFSHIEGRVWDNGSLYSPKKGKTYSGMMTLKDSETLDLKGYIFLSFIVRTSSTWTRIIDDEIVPKVELRNKPLLIQLKEDCKEMIKIIESISLKPAEEVFQKIEKEKLLIKLQLDLSKVIKKIEKIKKAE